MNGVRNFSYPIRLRRKLVRKPWDHVVPIYHYHAMLSEGDRAMYSILGFLGTVILLLTMVNHAHADAVREDAEGLRTEVVLEASEIDSRTVEVGGLGCGRLWAGERHPTSGEWATLDTARGYIKAVDPRRLIVGLEPDGWSKWIALTRIQTLRLIGSSSLGAADRNSTQVDSGRHRERVSGDAGHSFGENGERRRQGSRRPDR